MTTKKSSKRAGKKPVRRATTPYRKRKVKPARSLNEILIDLGRQALQEGVRQVLEDHGIDSSVKVAMALTKPRGGVKAKKPAKRRAKRG